LEDLDTLDDLDDLDATDPVSCASLIALIAAIADPQQPFGAMIPNLSTTPSSLPFEKPMCGPYSTKALPPVGMWERMAPTPTLPAKGKPERPPRLK